MQRQQPRNVFAVALIGAITIGAAPARGEAKRPVPDYDGRGNADAESWALWIPRAVLAPAYLVHEYALRRPLGALITHAERERWASDVRDLITFGSRQQYMVFPTMFYDFGLSPSVGLHGRASGIGAERNDITMRAATWGRNWIVAGARDHYRSIDGKTSIDARVDVSRRPDHLYMGIGPDVRKADRSRYGLQKLEASSSFSHRAGDAQLVVQAGVRRLDFRPGDSARDPMLADRIRDQMIEVPPGYGEPYTALYQRLALTLDSRSPRRPGTGARLAIHGESDFDTTSDRRWTKLGASLGGGLDLTGNGRTLKLQVAAELVDPFGGGDEVPFTELAQLGGDGSMQGFVTGWMRGRSAVTAELAYTWPVWFCLDGSARLSAGNAFGAQLAGFAPGKLRVSGDIGIATIGSLTGLELLVGVGSETLDHGGHITSFRFAFGTRRGF